MLLRPIFKGIAIVVLWIALAGCVHQTTEIKFVVPEDFHGEIQVFENPTAANPKAQVPTQITLTVP